MRFVRALEGAFLVHREGQDAVVLNRKGELADGTESVPLEIALCRECGQHYYVGRQRHGRLEEAVRDPSQPGFGVEHYRPLESSAGASHVLCRRCGRLSAAASATPGCNCGASAVLHVAKCASHKDQPDQLKQCATCGYQRGGVGDPVQEIVHGSDGPNAVIATALHELLPETGRKLSGVCGQPSGSGILRLVRRGLLPQAARSQSHAARSASKARSLPRGCPSTTSDPDCSSQWGHAGLFSAADTAEGRRRRVLESILREALTDERRLSLSGVGLVKWSVRIPDEVVLPEGAQEPPWSLSERETHRLLRYLLDELRLRGALELPAEAGAPAWNDVSPWPQVSYGVGAPGKRRNVRQWGSAASAVVAHFLHRLLADSGLSDEDKRSVSIRLMRDMWSALRTHDGNSRPADQLLSRGSANGAFRLNSRWLRIALTRSDGIWECDTCASISLHNIRAVCPRNRCPGKLRPADQGPPAQQSLPRHLRERVVAPDAARRRTHGADRKR